MFFYKLRKIFREKWLEILRGASMLGFIASFIPFFAYLFIWHDDFSRGEKRQMFLVSMICIIINLTIVYFTESIFGFNIIFSIFLADLFSFCLYVSHSKDNLISHLLAVVLVLLKAMYWPT